MDQSRTVYTAATAPSTRPRSRACDSLCRRPIQTSAPDAIANTASTAQCEEPYAENSRLAEISATNSVAWSHTTPTISAEITPQRRRQDCGHLRVYRNRRHTRVSSSSVIPEGAGPCQHVADQRFCRLSASV